MTSWKWNCFYKFRVAFIFARALRSQLWPVIPTPGIRAHLEVLGWALPHSQFLSLCSRERRIWWGTAETSQTREKLLPEEHGAETPQCLCKESAWVTQPQLLAGHLHLGLYLSPDNRGWQLFLPQGPWPRSGTVAEHQQTGCIKCKIGVDKSKR